MEINIKPEDIDAYVKEALMKSTIGKDLEVHIKAAFNEVFNGWKNPIKTVVNQHINNEVKNFIELPENREKINAAITKYVTPEVIDEIINKGVYNFMKKLEDR